MGSSAKQPRSGTLLKMLESYWLQRQTLHGLQQNIDQLKDVITEARKENSMAQAKLQEAVNQNTWLQKLVEDWRARENSLIENYEGQLRLERKRKWRIAMIVGAVCLGVGAMAGMMAK